MQNKTTINIFILVSMLFFSLVSISFAQEKLKEKLSKIDADVEKITITAGGEEFTFEGNEAAKLFKKMKSHMNANSFIYKIDEEESNGDRKIIIKSFGDGDKCLHHVDEDFIWFDDDSGSCMKKIFISIDGDEEIIEFNHDNDSDISWFGKGEHGMTKKVKVEIEDGIKKITVTTNENGEEKTEVYEGDEAEEYLEKMKSEHGNEMLIEMDEDGNHKKMKKIIIEKKEEKEDSDK